MGEQGQNQTGRPACLRAPPAPPPAPAHPATLTPPTPRCDTKGVAAGRGGRQIGRLLASARPCSLCGRRAFVPFRFPTRSPLPPLLLHPHTGRVRRQRGGARPAGRAAVFPGAWGCELARKKRTSSAGSTQTRRGGGLTGPASRLATHTAACVAHRPDGGVVAAGRGGGEGREGEPRAAREAREWSANDRPKRERAPPPTHALPHPHRPTRSRRWRPPPSPRWSAARSSTPGECVKKERVVSSRASV